MAAQAAFDLLVIGAGSGMVCLVVWLLFSPHTRSSFALLCFFERKLTGVSSWKGGLLLLARQL